MTLPQSTIAPEISAAKVAVTIAKQDLTEAVKMVQDSCDHDIVSECDWKGSEYFAPLNARRICNHCGIEEKGSHWSGGATWSKHDHSDHAVLGNRDGRIVVNVPRDVLYSMRPL